MRHLTETEQRALDRALLSSVRIVHPGKMKDQQVCELGGSCKQQNKIWSIINPKTNKLHRLTFSESLCRLILQTLGGDYTAKRVEYVIGKTLNPGEVSKSGLYAIMSKSKEIALRISLDKRTADLYTDNNSRYLAEAWLLGDKNDNS